MIFEVTINTQVEAESALEAGMKAAEALPGVTTYSVRVKGDKRVQFVNVDEGTVF